MNFNTSINKITKVGYSPICRSPVRDEFLFFHCGSCRRADDDFAYLTYLPSDYNHVTRPFHVMFDNGLTISDFAECLPQVLHAIDSADFICIDGEFTGLRNGVEATAYDTPAEYYKKLRDGSLNFLLIQVGISAFKFDPSSKMSVGGFIYLLTCGQLPVSLQHLHIFISDMFTKRSISTFFQDLSIKSAMTSIFCVRLRP